MSVELVNLAYKVKGLSSSEHSVLNVLAFRANDKTYECWPSVASLVESTSLDRKTVLKCFKSLLEKKLIIKTDKKAGKTKSTPVYKVTISSSTKIGTAKNSSSPNFSDSSPKNGTAKQSQNWDMERSIIKEKGKDFFLSLKPENQEQAQTIFHLLKTGLDPNSDELKVLKPLIDKCINT